MPDFYAPDDDIARAEEDARLRARQTFNLAQVPQTPYATEDDRVRAAAAQTFAEANPGPMAPNPSNDFASSTPSPIVSPQPVTSTPADTQMPHRRTGGGGGTGGIPTLGAQTVGEVRARGEEQLANEAEKNTAVEGKRVAVAKADKEAELAGAEDERIQAFEARRQQQMSEGMAYLRQKQDERSKMQVRDMFEGREGARVGSALMVGLGAFASSLTGGPNGALHIIEQEKDRYERRQLHAIEQANRGVEDAKDLMHLGSIELAAEEAGMYKSLASTRAKNLSVFGHDEAAIKSDALYNELLKREADASQRYEGMLYGRLYQQQEFGLKKAVAGSEMAKNAAEVRKLNAEAGAPGAGKGDRAAAHKIDLGIYGASVVDQLDEADKMKLSDKEIADGLRKIQQNETRLASAKPENIHGVKDALGAEIGRGVGYTPESRLAGLSSRQQKYFNNLDIASKKVATVLAGQGRSNSHEMMERLNIQPSDTPELIKQKLIEMKSIGAEAKDEASQYGDVAAEAIRRTKAAGGAAAAPAKPTTRDYAEGMQFLHNLELSGKKGGPEWQRAKATLDGIRRDLNIGP